MKKILITIGIVALVLFSGCSNEIREEDYILIGTIDEYVEYYPSTFSNQEKCMLIISGQKQIIQDNNCDIFKEGDLLYKDKDWNFYKVNI